MITWINPVRYSIIIILFVIAGHAESQHSFFSISGLLKNAENGDKVSFASVTVPGTGIGTVSNSDGEFILKVDTSLQVEFFEVSHLSYSTVKYKIVDAIGEEKTYYLDLQPVGLKEVTIISGNARTLVELALHKTKENYSEVPSMMTGFYRESIMQNRDFISISEAVVDIYKAPYPSLQKDQVRIFKGRKGSPVKKADTLLVELQGGPSVLMLLDVVKNIDLSIAFDNLDNYHFNMESVAYIDDQLNWVIDFSPAVILNYPLYFGKLYISQYNTAITRCEFNLDLKDEFKAANAFVRKKPVGLLFRPTSTSYLVTYKKSGGRYYLNYVRVELKFKCDWKRKVFRKNYTLISELAITDRRQEGVTRFSKQEVFKSTMIFTSEVDDFTDENFWGENNIIEPEKSIEFAIQKLVKSQRK